MQNKRQKTWKEAIGAIDALYWIGAIIAIVFFS